MSTGPVTPAGRERILQVAPLLWGRRWQTAMAEELRLAARTLRKYLAGRRVPPELILELDGSMILRVGKIAAALPATSVMLLPDGALLAFTAEGEPVEIEGELRDRIRAVLDEAAHLMKGPADAEK